MKTQGWGWGTEIGAGARTLWYLKSCLVVILGFLLGWHSKTKTRLGQSWNILLSALLQVIQLDLLQRSFTFRLSCRPIHRTMASNHDLEGGRTIYNRKGISKPTHKPKGMKKYIQDCSSQTFLGKDFWTYDQNSCKIVDIWLKHVPFVILHEISIHIEVCIVLLNEPMSFILWTFILSPASCQWLQH